MAGPVRQSPSITQVAKAPAEQHDHKALTLVEKFAQQMGGVEPTKMLSTLKQTAFKVPDRKQGSNWVPQEVTNEQMMALLVVANKYDLNPFIKEIYAFPDKGGIVPIVGVDGWARMTNNHDQFDGIKFTFSDERVDMKDAKNMPESCTCTIYRKDRSHPTEVTEYLEEVYREQRGTYPGPWQTHTRRMLRHKAMIQCARLAFGFTGIVDHDEAERIVESEYIPAEKPAKAQDLTNRFATTPTDADLIEIVEEEDITVEPEPEPAPTLAEVGDKRHHTSGSPAKKAAGNATDVVSDILQQIMAAKTEADIDVVLTDLEGFKGVSQAKRMIIKRAAAARKKDL